MKNIWVIAPFDYENPEIWQRVWQFNLKEGFISLGWRALKNASKLTAAEIYKLHRKTYTHPEVTERGAMADSRVLAKFWAEIEVGHTIVARRGRKSIAAIGTVTSAPYYQPNKAKTSFAPEPAYPNHIDVEWQDDPRDLNFPTQVFGMQALHSLSPEKLRALLKQTSAVTSSIYADEIVSDKDYVEGGRKTVVVNAYERSLAAVPPASNCEVIAAPSVTCCLLMTRAKSGLTSSTSITRIPLRHAASNTK